MNRHRRGAGGPQAADERDATIHCATVARGCWRQQRRPGRLCARCAPRAPARETADTDARGGTLPYMWPEVLAGRPAAEADDVWSLCVVLNEMVSGRHPFADGGSAADVRDRIERQRLSEDDSLTARSGLSSAVLALTAWLLTAPRSARPATARAFTDALEAMVAAQR